MAKTIDVYKDWLKIADTNRPLNHYQLLRLKKFEDNTAKIREHYKAMNAHVRKFAAGEFAKESQDLLNELAKSMLCLTDARRKGEYDASLGRADAGDGAKTRTFEQILLASKVIDQPTLDKVRNFAKAINVEVRDALVQQKLAKYDAVLPAYAESVGLPYLDLTDIPMNPQLIAAIPAVTARTHSCVPVLIDSGQLLMASPNPLDPNVEEEVRLRFNMPVRTVLCTPANISDVLTKYVPKDGSAPAPVPTGPAIPPAAAPAGTIPAPAAAAPARPAGPMTEEEKKARQQAAYLALGMTTIVAMNGLYYGTKLGFILAALIALPIAAAAGFVAWKMKTP